MAAMAKMALKLIKRRCGLFLIWVRLKTGRKIKIASNPKILDKAWGKNEITCCLDKPRKNRGEVDLSLIVPLYNSEVFVKGLVENLGSQKTSFKYEVIFVDDGSTDGTNEMVKNCIKRYAAFMRVITKENGGLSSARNAGLAVVRGKYVGFIDGDDLVDEMYVEKLLRAAYENNADVVKCGHANMKEGKVTLERCGPNEVIEGGMGEKILDYPSYAWAGIFKWELVNGLEFPTSYWYEDMITRFLIFRKSQKFVNIGEVLYFRVIHDEQMTRTTLCEENPKCLEHLYLIECLLDDNMKRGLPNDLFLYMNVVLECSSIAAHRIEKMDDKVKRQVFLRLCRIVKKLYKKSYDGKLCGDLKIQSEVFLKKRYDLWLTEKNFL